MTHEDVPEGWSHISSGRTFGGLPAIAVAGFLLIWKVVSLQWLWVRWKNKPEALAELQRIVAEHEVHGYAYWVDRVGHEKRLEFTTPPGTWYQATVEPVWDGEPGGTIRILFSLDDGGSSAFFPMSDSLLVERTG